MTPTIVPSAIVLHRKTLLAGEVLAVKKSRSEWTLCHVLWSDGTMSLEDGDQLMVTAQPGPGGWAAVR